MDWNNDRKTTITWKATRLSVQVCTQALVAVAAVQVVQHKKDLSIHLPVLKVAVVILR